MLHILGIKCSLSTRVLIQRNDVKFIKSETALREMCGHGINSSKTRRSKSTAIPQRRKRR